MSHDRPDPASLNRLQRWVLARSAARYEALEPELRRIAVERDLFLASGQSAGLWIGLGCGIAGTTVGLSLGGGSPPMAPWLAFIVAAGLFAGLFKVGMGLWLRPERFTAKRMWRIGWIALIATYAGAIASFRGDVRPLMEAGAPWYEAALRVFWRATPLQIMVLIAALLLITIVSAARREYMARALEAARAEHERDTQARQLAQARLALLQAQIQPHFLFNTLAALQHWLDAGDARAAPLLRDLTAFLRGSTEAMLRPEASVADECAMAGRYLAIMQARLGARLRWAIDVAPACALHAVPSGLVLTLVENAVGHGIEPQLHGGEVRVVARGTAAGGLDLQVLDDGAGLATGPAPEGVGLANCRERLRHQFGDRATLTLTPRVDGPGCCARLQIDAPA